MKVFLLVYGVIIFAWWYAIWALADILTEHWSCEDKTVVFVGVLTATSAGLLMYPNHIRIA